MKTGYRRNFKVRFGFSTKLVFMNTIYVSTDTKIKLYCMLKTHFFVVGGGMRRGGLYPNLNVWFRICKKNCSRNVYISMLHQFVMYLDRSWKTRANRYGICKKNTSGKSGSLLGAFLVLHSELLFDIDLQAVASR